MTHLFDTSAVLAHYLNEPGAERVTELIADPAASLGVSTLTLYEVEIRLAREGFSPVGLRQVIEGYLAVFPNVVPVSKEIAALGASLRQETSARIAAVDLLIAATALSEGAILVHRDAHFAALPPGRPAQEIMPDKV